MGAFDDLIPGAGAAGSFSDLVPKRGPIGEIAASAQRSLYSGVRGAGAVLQAPAEMAGSEPGIISRLGKSLEDYGRGGEERPDLQPEPEKHGPVTNFIARAAAAPGEALPLLATTIPAASAGAAIGSALAPGPGTVAGAIGGAVGSGVAGGATTALQTYHEKYHEALDKGLSDSDARDYAAKSATLQGGMMGAVSAVPFAGPVARTALGAPARGAAEAMADVAGKRFLPEFAKSAGELTAVNTGLGVAGAAGQAAIDQDTGLPTPSPGDATLQAVVPSLAGAVGFMPLAVHSALATAHASSAIRTPLEDAQAPVADRVKAAMQVHGALHEVDPDLASAWDANAARAIHEQQPIALDPSFLNGGGKSETPAEPLPETPAPTSAVDPSRGPLSTAAAIAERATLPAFPFASPDAANASIAGRGAPPEGWDFDVQRHPSVTNRWAVSLRRLTKEETDARAVEGEAPGKPAEGAEPAGADTGALAAGGLPPADLSGAALEAGAEAPHVDALAHEAATSPLNERPEPTPAQVEAGNYKKGHLDVQGLDISVENPAGSIRRGTDADGRSWEQVMQDHYGYIRGTVGRDKDHVDVFVGPNRESNRAFVVDQVDPKTGRFDEHKVVLGADSLDSARDLYHANYEPGWRGMGAIHETTIEGLKRWFRDGDTTKPFADQERSERATRPGEEQGGDLGQREGAGARLPEGGEDRLEPPQEHESRAEAGSGDRALDGAPQPVAPEPEDFTTRQGEVKTFGSEKGASAYARNRTNRVPGNFSPRETPDGWVLSRPTRERTPAQRANDARLASNRRQFDPQRDSLGTFMGKMGGLRAADLTSDGVDPADLKHLRSGVVGSPAVRKKGGLSLDGMAELAAAHGFDVLDERGHVDASKLRDLIDEELAGNSVFTAEGHEHQAALSAEARAREEELRHQNDFAEDELKRAGYDDLSEEGQALVEMAFDDDLDRLIAAATDGAEMVLTDDEAHALFGRPEEPVREAPEGAPAGRAREGREDREAPARDEGEARSVGKQDYAQFAGRTVTEKVTLDDGRTATLTHQADAALRDLDQRIETVQDLLRCLA